MKDGRTHLAYKAEHVVDLMSNLVLAAEIRPDYEADMQTIVDCVMNIQMNQKKAGSEQQIEEAAADRGCHAAKTIELYADLNLRTYVSEPKYPPSRVGQTSHPSFSKRFSTIGDDWAKQR